MTHISVNQLTLEEWHFTDYVKILSLPNIVEDRFISFLQHSAIYKVNPYIHYQKYKQFVANFLQDMIKQYAQEIFELSQKIKNKEFINTTVIQNFIMDNSSDILDTPHDNLYNPLLQSCIGKKHFVAEWAMIAFATLCGTELITNPNIQNGLPIQHISKRLGKEKTASNGGTVLFPMHIEGTHLDHGDEIDYIMLLAIKNRHTPTLILPIDVLISNISRSIDNAENIFRNHKFKFIPLDAYNIKTNNYCISTMMYNDERIGKQRFKINANVERVFSGNKNMDFFIQLIYDISENLKKPINLKPKELLIINNINGAMHGRAPLDPRDDERPLTNRHLLRQQLRYR